VQYLLLGGKARAALEGRTYVNTDDVRAVAHPVLRHRIITNFTAESEGINSDMVPGELMLIADQINMTGKIVLPGSVPSGPDDPGTDDRCLYDRSLSDMLLESAASAGVEIHRGVYAGGVGPSYETAAEIRMLKRMGADAVGMSTVLEALAGKRLGMRVAGISVITNLATGISPSRLSHEEVTSGAALAVERLRAVIQGFLVRFAALR
jgi:purine-nucleoside phosphorylase